MDIKNNIKQEPETDLYLSTSDLFDMGKSIKFDNLDEADLQTCSTHSEVCRLCAQSVNSTDACLFDERRLQHKINSLLPIVVEEGDNLPNQLCHECETELIKFEAFVSRVIRIDKRFRRSQVDTKLTSSIESVSIVTNPKTEVVVSHVGILNENNDDENQFPCQQCDKIFISKETLRLHEANKHPKYICDICSITFNARVNYETHKKRHLSVENFQCIYCYKQFAKRFQLLRHTRQCHSGDFHMVF